MWKKQDDAERQKSDLPSKERSDAKLLGESLSHSSPIDNAETSNLAAAAEIFPTKHSDQPLPSPTMNTYTDAVREFTTNATAFIEHLPLLSKARKAYQEAMRASAEMRKVLDTSDQNLRSLMTQLEEKINLQELKPPTDKKPPEPIKADRMKGAGEGEGRAYRWP